jgi:hypothetical protein
MGRLGRAIIRELVVNDRIPVKLWAVRQVPRDCTEFVNARVMKWTSLEAFVTVMPGLVPQEKLYSESCYRLQRHNEVLHLQQDGYSRYAVDYDATKLVAYMSLRASELFGGPFHPGDIMEVDVLHLQLCKTTASLTRLPGVLAALVCQYWNHSPGQGDDYDTDIATAWLQMNQ